MKRTRLARSGFSLIELLVVITILGLLSGITAFAIGSWIPQARQKAAAIQIGKFAEAIEAYRLNEKQGLPATLDVLFKPTRKNPEGYLQGGKVPDDPWGTPYVYQRRGSKYLITCYGANKAAGGEGYDADFTSQNYKEILN